MAELPQGTVTFLFTDIEGSTHLLKELRDGYGEVLGDQRRLLRGTFEENGGREIDMQGDAFFVAFESAKDAVAAAAAGQRAIAAHRWPRGIQVRVRMGLHTGEPSLSSEGYLGLAVHRTARICSAAHGSQVFLSRSTYALLEDDELEGVSLRDLGNHRLKDIERPERIYQLLIDGLLNDFRAPRAYEAQPLKATPFAGQENELALAAQEAMATRRKRIVEWARRSSTRYGVRSMQLLRRIVEAAWDSRLARLQLIATCVVVALGIAFEPWAAAVAVAAYAVLLGKDVKAHRFYHGIEGLGLRVHSLAALTPNGELREAIRELGGTMVRTSHLTAKVDMYVAGVSRKALAHQLDDLRKKSTGGPRELHTADTLARQIVALGLLVEHRQALEVECQRLESNLDSVRRRVFEVRLEPSLADDLRAELTASREQLGAITAQLAVAFEDMKSHSGLVNGQLRRLRA